MLSCGQSEREDNKKKETDRETETETETQTKAATKIEIVRMKAVQLKVVRREEQQQKHEIRE